MFDLQQAFQTVPAKFILAFSMIHNVKKQAITLNMLHSSGDDFGQVQWW